MAASKSLIVRGTPADNLVKKARCGLTVPPRDPQGLAEAAIKLYRMPKEEREAMGRRGRAYVDEHHYIAKLAARLEGILKQIS